MPHDKSSSSSLAKSQYQCPQQKEEVDESNMDRFATLFSPATPPATPTHIPRDLTTTMIPSRPHHQRHRTHSSTDSEFGAFVSVPPTQDPLSFDSELNSSLPLGASPKHRTVRPASRSPNASSDDYTNPVSWENRTLDYFDKFTSHAKLAAERNRHSILDELLEHQDDPLYFLNGQSKAQTPPAATPPLSPPIFPSLPAVKQEDIEEALTSELVQQQKQITRSQSKLDLKDVLGSRSPVRTRTPLPPRLSGTTSPPSTYSPPVPSPSPPPTTPQLASSPPAYDTLSRLSSSLVSSFLASSRPRSAMQGTASTQRTSFSAPSTFSHGSPFGYTPYIPPSGAPGFAGDRAWDKGFSEALAQDEELGTVDVMGLGKAAEMQAKGRVGGKGKGVSLVGRKADTACVLNEEITDLIRPHLPALTRLPRHWTLLYSLDQHGISLKTLYSHCEPRIPTKSAPHPPQGALFVVKDTRDSVFGAWLVEGIKQERGYYGSGESFLWRYHAPEREELQGKLSVYKWTGKNDYVALCEPEFISFGGGDGHYGLYVDASLLDGSSAPCPTFDNPVLCSHAFGSHADGGTNGIVRSKKDVNFECVGLEVWGIGPG